MLGAAAVFINDGIAGGQAGAAGEADLVGRRVRGRHGGGAEGEGRSGLGRSEGLPVARCPRLDSVIGVSLSALLSEDANWMVSSLTLMT